MQTLRDRLSRLTIEKATALLGKSGKSLIAKGRKFDIDLETDVTLSKNIFRLKVDGTYVSIVDDDRAEHKMRFFCGQCETVCEHVGAAFYTILEAKTPLGLAKPPAEEDVEIELTDEELVQREIARRQDRATKERMTIKSLDPTKPWSEYNVTSVESGKTYRVALRGLERGHSYCSCPDYRKNTLGTCKHIMKVLSSVSKKFTPKKLSSPHQSSSVEIFIRYDHQQQLLVTLPENLPVEIAKIFKPFSGKPVDSVEQLMGAIGKSVRSGYEPSIFPDAEDYIEQKLSLLRISQTVAEIRKDPAAHPLRKELLKVELLPYQLDGIAFAAGAGRAVLADDMGLGKTIQAIGTSELLSRYCDISKVLIVCPTSLKSQWCNEINRFCDRSSQQILGSSSERKTQYDNDYFFTICNYEQVLRDLLWIEPVKWDFIILDEGQRIKNWEAKTSQVVKALQSPFALVLSGTPLENRLDELYSVVEFINERQLGPAFRFYHQHRILDDRGRSIGYKNLDELRKRLEPVLLRRTRSTVMQQLPPRTTEIVRITPTEEQAGINDANVKIAKQIAAKTYLTEMDLLRLQKALLLARMSADSTFLVDKQEPSYSSKLEYLDELLTRLMAEKDRKILLFSEWTTMLDCIEKIIKKTGVEYVRLDGSTKQKERQLIVNKFQREPDCRIFMTSNAGSTGLNLQSANTIINVDLPWNPAILEQRIGRAHRMGQTRPVHVYLLVTERTIEENMLSTLAAKKDLALAALDPESDVSSVSMVSGMDELRKKLEILLGEKEPAPVDMSALEQASVEEPKPQVDTTRVSEAGGKLLNAAFSFIGEMIPGSQKADQLSPLAQSIQASFEQIAEKQPDGKLKVHFTFESSEALTALSSSIAMLLEASKGRGEKVAS
jgi:SNF2 family DNA or RNA helicase